MDDRLLLKVLNMDDGKLLAVLSREIEQLQAAKQELLARMNGSSNGHYSNGQQNVNSTVNQPTRSNTVAAIEEDHDEHSGMTRHEELIAYLTKHGPSLMREIVKGTGMPRGSASFTASRALAAGHVVQMPDKRYDVPR